MRTYLAPILAVYAISLPFVRRPQCASFSVYIVSSSTVVPKNK